MIRQFELVEKVKSYDPDADEDAINRAYVYAMKMHGSQKRANGDPYFSHPVEVAYLLTQFKLDTTSIITALLHDTVEDTDATLEEIEELFGPQVRNLVDGVTKLTQLEVKSESTKQAENFRKLLIAMSDDLRVLLVKLADRLHNMRTLHFIKSEDKRKRIAKETLEIYSALAERIGMRAIKDELQDIAFSQLYPEARESIINRLEYLREQGKAEIERTQANISRVLDEVGLTKYEVSGREKRPYSIWKKMEMKNTTFEQLSDIIAFRVVVDTIPECYQALGAIHAKYHTVPGSFKDYISTPKANGYQSIHTAVIGPQQHKIEVQIRTHEMHDFAEYGVAAHWSYKQNQDAKKEGRQYRWIRELLEILEKSSEPEEFLENTKLEMYHDQVFCFSPKGDLLGLPRGSTPVDFAFAVHSKVGFACVGAKVNGRIVPLRTQLHNGDQVEIITSKNSTPSPAWERFVVTGKARSEIRKFVRTQQRNEYINLGRAILQKTFKQEGQDLSEKQLEGVLNTLGRKTIDDIFAEVGEGILNRLTVLEAVHPELRAANAEKRKTTNLLDRLRKKKPQTKSGHAIPITGLIPGMAVHFAGCCHPIPGDKIVGIVTTGKGVTIHTVGCETLENYADTPERWLDVAWETDHAANADPKAPAVTKHTSRLKIEVSNDPGSLATITNVIAKDMGNITNIKVVNRAVDYFDLLLDVEVRDTSHLSSIIANLRTKDAVQAVSRVHG
jgi:guanosine-3',5'-bis(diphosphate) 3'-pyrophosphohydrolase